MEASVQGAGSSGRSRWGAAAPGWAVPPVGFGLAGGALFAVIILFIASLFGGYVGGKLGEPSRLAVRRAR